MTTLGTTANESSKNRKKALKECPKRLNGLSDEKKLFGTQGNENMNLAARNVASSRLCHNVSGLDCIAETHFAPNQGKQGIVM